MAQAVRKKRKKEELLSGATPKLNLSVVPIAAGVAAASTPEATPMPSGNVVSIHKMPRKTRFDFKSDLDYQLYLEFQKIQEKEQAQRLAALKELRNEGLVELPEPSDLLSPAAAASPVTLDESAELAAYLAHHNPTGCTKAIPTVKGTITLADGMSIIVNKRQDLIEDGEPVLPYNGYDADGMVFWLTGDRSKDRRAAEHLTRRSQNARRALGKDIKTEHKNLHVIHEYRPVPDHMWFLNNPDGKSFFRGDLNPYPVGIVPTGKDEAQYHQDKTEHAAKVNNWLYVTQFNRHKAMMAAALMTTEPDERQISDHIRLDMMSHDRVDLEIMVQAMATSVQGREMTDDIPWSYDEPIEVIGQVSVTQGSDATEVVPEPGRSNPKPLSADVLESIVSKAKPQYTKHYLMLEGRKAEEPEPEETVIVAADGRAFPVGKVRPEDIPSIAASVSTMQPQSETRQEGEDLVSKLSLDLRDPKAAATLRILERRIRSDIKELQGHLWNVVGARMLAEQYRKTGTFEQPDMDSLLDVADAELVIEPVKYNVRKLDQHHKPAQYWRAPSTAKTRFASIMRRSEELQVERDDHTKRMDAAMLRYLKSRAKYVALERASLAKMGAKIRMRQKAGTLEVLASRHHILMKQVAKDKAMIEALARHKAEVGKWLNEERRFYRALGVPNKFSGRAKIRAYKASERARKFKGKSKRFLLRLGILEERVIDPAPSMEPERPINEPVMPVVTPLPARQPPEPEPEPVAETTLALPEMKVVTYDNDPVLHSLRRAHLMRLAKTGKFTPEELKAADRVFTMVA